MATVEDVVAQVERLTGEIAVRERVTPERVIHALDSTHGLGYSQFNELLLLCGFDRICPELFQFIVTGSTDYFSGSGLHSVADLEAGVDRFRKLALLAFGNVKFGFKELGGNADRTKLWVEAHATIGIERYEGRHDPIQPIQPIAPSDTYLLGYLIEAEIKRRLADPATRADAQALQDRRDQIVERGKANHAAYLVSDHLDVYVATSMREPHEFLVVNQLCTAVFAHSALAPLKLRWFDPTQAYCHDRVDKGLAEALMLKRARCTLYLAQESDTLGKDSELASTLAQGKPVIAYVPKADDAFVDALLEKTSSAEGKPVAAELMLKQLRAFRPDIAWTDAKVRAWIDDPAKAQRDVAELRGLLIDVAREHYEKRAQMLRETHPLGIQVNLGTGVANGVLVVRSEDDCAQLIRGILTAGLVFDLEDQTVDGRTYTYLRERISACIFRVMTGDRELTNAFWNFYLQ